MEGGDLGERSHLGVADESDPLEDGHRPDDERGVRGDAEGELVCDLGEVCSKLLKVERLGTAAGEGGVEDAREGGDDRGGVDAARDKVHVDEVVANVLIVTVNQMRNGLNHAKSLVLCDLSHQSKIEDDELAVGRAEHVARMRVRMEEPSL